MRLITAFSLLYLLFLCLLTWGALYPRHFNEPRNMAVERYCLRWAVSLGVGKVAVDERVLDGYFECLYEP